MKRYRVLAVLAALMISGVVFAQTYGNWGQKNQPTQSATTPQVPAVRVTVTGGVNTTDTSFVPFQFDTDNGMKVHLQNSPQSLALLQPAWLNDDFLHFTNGGPVGTVIRDSTTAVDVRGYNGLGLMIYPTFDDSTAAAVFAIQYRWHYSSVVDSQSTFVESQTTKVRGNVAIGTVPTGVARDSIGSLTWSNDKYVGTAGFGDSLATPNEEVLVLNNTVGNPRGIFVRVTPPAELPALQGAGPYFSIRLRHLNTFSAAGAAYGSGTQPATEVRTRVRVDLVGWR